MASVQPLVVVVVHEKSDSSVEHPGAVVILEPDHVPHRAVIAIDPALRPRMVGSASGVLHLMHLELLAKDLGE